MSDGRCVIRVLVHARQWCGLCLVAAGLFAIGCQGPGVAQPLDEVATGPWRVMTRSAPGYAYQFDIGPFHTSEVGVLQSMAGRRQEKPTTETVKYLNDKIVLAYDLRHSGGAIAQVRTGPADTGEVHQIGFLKTAKKDTTAGSVSIDGVVVGEFLVRLQKKPFWGKPSTEPNSEIESGTVSTSRGTIRIIHRFDDPPPSKYAATAIFKPDTQAVEEYILGDRIVATRRDFVNTTVKIDQDLPIDVQLCITAAMMFPIFRRAVDDTGAQQAAMNSTTSRLIMR